MCPQFISIKLSLTSIALLNKFGVAIVFLTGSGIERAVGIVVIRFNAVAN